MNKILILFFLPLFYINGARIPNYKFNVNRMQFLFAKDYKINDASAYYYKFYFDPKTKNYYCAINYTPNNRKDPNTWSILNITPNHPLQGRYLTLDGIVDNSEKFGPKILHPQTRVPILLESLDISHEILKEEAEQTNIDKVK